MTTDDDDARLQSKDVFAGVEDFVPLVQEAWKRGSLHFWMFCVALSSCNTQAVQVYMQVLYSLLHGHRDWHPQDAE